jgi:hypothetical protein
MNLTSDEIKAVATYLWGSPRKWQDDSRANGLSLVASGFTVLWIAGSPYFDYAEALLSPDGRAAMEEAVIEKYGELGENYDADRKQWSVCVSVPREDGLRDEGHARSERIAEALASAVLDLLKGRK